MKKIAIVGAGIAGLTAACLLKRRGYDIRVFEQGTNVGGVMRSVREGEYLAEFGPNTILESSPEVSEFFNSLGLENRKVYPENCAKIRYIVCRGKLVALPMSPPAFLKSNLFPPRAKFRLLCEPLIPSRKSRKEETISQFVKRRLGKEILDYAINPFVAGTYAGRPDKLSIEHAFPKLHNLEKEYGSVIRGQIQMKKSGRKPPKIISFPNGLEEFPQAMYKEINPQNVYLNAKVENINFDKSGKVEIETVDQKYQASKIIYAGTAYGLRNIKINKEPLDFPILDKVYYPPVTVLCLGFKRSDIKHSLNGFGFLVPEKEQAFVLGTLFSSSLFNNRAPKDHVLLTVFIGGARQPQHALQTKREVVSSTIYDLNRYLGVTGQPTYTHFTKWEKSIPQYEIGYGDCKKAFAHIEQKYHDLRLIGNYREGVSIIDTIRYAQKVVASI
ncbi:protoporphyrinogen oxidase [Candidatus Uabimicrobium sp. HlEnr_7]|uniref:protoporphyrinogen oxidase n=1 Tax=Candidatus Uabimicrobium helgolandensis TaxID=3095367 RepID=UPI0035586DB5